MWVPFSLRPLFFTPPYLFPALAVVVDQLVGGRVPRVVACPEMVALRQQERRELQQLEMEHGLNTCRAHFWKRIGDWA